MAKCFFSKLFPLREVPIMNSDENHCSPQYFPFDVRNYSSVLATLNCSKFISYAYTYSSITSLTHTRSSNSQFMGWGWDSVRKR